MKDLYDDVVDQLGIEDFLEDVLGDQSDNTPTDQLQKLNQRLRSVESEIEKIRSLRDDLQSSIAGHNKKAREYMEDGNEKSARDELQEKQRKLDQVDELNRKLYNLEEQKQNIQQQRQRILDMLS